MNLPVSASTGMVASSQQLATQVGVELLQQGGSAVDAAIGVNAMLNLIEPYMCGLGGDLFAQVWAPATRTLHGLNASGRAARGQSLAALREKLGAASAIPSYGVHAVTVPGAVAGWSALHQRFGRLPLGDLFAPVIAHAKAGVTIGPVTAEWWRYNALAINEAPSLGALADGFRDVFLRPDGTTPGVATQFTNDALGRTYARLAEAGFDDFYHGELARRLGNYLGACGSSVTVDDLAACTAQWVDPITTRYRGYDVFELPPNGQGLSVLQILNMLECYPLADFGHDSPDYWHLFLEAKKLAFEDRGHYFADPEFAHVPVQDLAAKAYGRERAALIGELANPHPAYGDPALARGDTTYLSVADGDGMMVSLIQSIYTGFGSGLVAPDLGFALQSRGAGFALDPAHANVYAPGKRPFHTIIPAFVMQGGEPLMSFGVMGADMQPQGQVQVLVNLIDFGMDLQAAGDAARLRHDGSNHPDSSVAAQAGIVWHEPASAPGVITALQARGHDVRPASDPVQHFMGGYQCIRREPGGWTGASESRFDGCAAGY